MCLPQAFDSLQHPELPWFLLYLKFFICQKGPPAQVRESPEKENRKYHCLAPFARDLWFSGWGGPLSPWLLAEGSSHGRNTRQEKAEPSRWKWVLLGLPHSPLLWNPTEMGRRSWHPVTPLHTRTRDCFTWEQHTVFIRVPGADPGCSWSSWSSLAVYSRCTKEYVKQFAWVPPELPGSTVSRNMKQV